MEIPKPTEADRERFAGLVPEAPDVEVVVSRLGFLEFHVARFSAEARRFHERRGRHQETRNGRA